MRVIYAGLSCLVLASVVACGGQAADDKESSGLDAGEDDASVHTGRKPTVKGDDAGPGHENDTESSSGDPETDESSDLDVTGDVETDSNGDPVGPATNDGAGGGVNPVATGSGPNQGAGGSGGSGDPTSDPSSTASGSPTSDSSSDPIDNETDETVEPETDETDEPIGPTPSSGGGGMDNAGGAPPLPTMGQGGMGNPPPVVIINPINLPEVTIPAGCTKNSTSSGKDFCGGDFYCDDDYYSSNCSRSNDGWSCSCSTNNEYFNYTLTGLAEADRCTYPLELCKSGKLSASGTETCETDTSDEGDSCSAQSVCSQTIDLGGGISAEKFVYGTSLNCYSNGTDDGSCQCYEASGNTKYYSVSGATGSAMCTALTGPCIDGTPIVFGEPECSEPEENTFSESCDTSSACTKTADLGSGVSITSSGSLYASCYDYGDSWQCTCQSIDYYLNFSTAATPASYCDLGLAVCDEAGGTTDWSVGRTCKVDSTNATNTNCYGSTLCGWDKEIDGSAVTLTGSESVSCSADDTDWVCSCNSHYNETFRVPLGEDSFDSCGVAIAQCEQYARPGYPINSGPIFDDFGPSPGMTSSPVPVATVAATPAL